MFTEDVFIDQENIILIGNGIPERNYGKLIDNFGCVVRFNNYNINPKYFEIVGQKTDVWCVNGNPKIKPMSDIMPVTPFTRKYFPGVLLKTFEKNIGKLPIFAKHDWIKESGVKYPRTGFLLALMVLSLGKHVTIVGFNDDPNQKHLHEYIEGGRGHIPYLKYETEYLKNHKQINFLK